MVGPGNCPWAPGTLGTSMLGTRQFSQGRATLGPYLPVLVGPVEAGPCQLGNLYLQNVAHILLYIGCGIGIQSKDGHPGNRDLMLPRLLLDGPKSCPHWDTQCVSSTAIPDTLSGVDDWILCDELWDLIQHIPSCSCFKICFGLFWAEASRAADIPDDWRPSTWSSMREMRGDTTITTLLSYTAWCW